MMQEEEDGHFEGFLTKRGKLIKNWKRRYFTLDDGVMTYRASKQGKILGTFNVKGCQCGSCAALSKQYTYNIQVFTEERTWFMYASSLEEFDNWKEKLRANGALWNDSVNSSAIIKGDGSVLFSKED